MNIYGIALSSLEHGFEDGMTIEQKDLIMNALLKAQKEHELLGLYETEKHLAPHGVVFSKSIEEEVRLNARLKVISSDIKLLKKEIEEMK